MNYLSHAAAFLDDPPMAAGSVLPDLLSAVDRRCRVRAAKVEAYLVDAPLTASQRAVATGLQQHLADDHWFHGTEAFLSCSSTLARKLRAALPDDETHRVGFLGHILVELMLDGWIERSAPGTVDRFYAALSGVSTELMTRVVNACASRPTTRIAEVWPGFLRERFIADYVSDAGLRRRVNQVLRRVRLPQLAESIEPVLADCRQTVEANAEDLLPRRVLMRLGAS